ncbi:hypothetical protein MTR66_20845, partial [Novosphingobium sp. 2638]|nr:hypothetical protein [Novosphingobium beihaiensis]
MSSLLSANIGYKQGTRGKLFGRDWDLETGLAAPDTPEYVAGLRRYMQGFSLRREEMPEAAAVWNEKYFKKVGDLFAEGGIYVVRGKLAEILSRFDLGEGGLVPFPVYKADLETPYPGEFFLLNFGARKNTLVPEASPNVAERGVSPRTGQMLWKVQEWGEGQVALSPAALDGPDLWGEEVLDNKIFMSDALA